MPDSSASWHPLTESQLRFWRGHQLAPTVPLYNMAWRFDLYQALDPTLFGEAFNTVVAQSDILRAVFETHKNEPMQSVASTSFELPKPLDLSMHTDPESAIGEHLDIWIKQPFDLTKATLRSQLVKLTDNHWVWFVCQHHIACDAQSGSVLFDAVSDKYQGLKSGLPSQESRFAQYFEFAEHHPADEERKDVTRTRPISLPYGTKPSNIALSERIAVPLPDDFLAQFERFCSSQEYRLFTPDLSQLAAYVTAYLAFLYRITSDEHLTIGLPSHNRLNETDRNTLGLFVEVLPLAVEIDPSDSFADLHAKVKSALGNFLRSAKPGAIAKQNTGDISAVLNFIKAGFGDFADAPAKTQWLHSGAHDLAHSLRLHVTDFNETGKPELTMDVNQSVLGESWDNEIASHFANTLRILVTSPEKRISASNIGGSSDKVSFIEGPKELADSSKSIVDLITSQAELAPDAIAIESGDHTLSYGQMNALSDGVAVRIRDHGIKQGSPVAVYMKRSPECLIAILGILKADCCFVPIAANTPAARAKLIVAQCDASAIFMSEADDSFHIPVLIVPSQAEHATIEAGASDPENLAYILFTSGSTGTPKGVSVTHEGLTRYIQWAAQEYGHGQKVDFPFFSSLSFDLTITSLFTPLITGGRVVVYPERSDPDLAVLNVFADDRVDIVKLTPSHLSLVCKNAKPVRRIRSLILGGENLTTGLCRLARKTLSPDIEILNEYGPTEAVVGCMIHRFDPDMDTSASVPIGTPSPGVSISLRDVGMNICPIGVPGEMIISGRLSAGYFGQAELTDAVFCSEPDGPQQRFYRTGDLGRLLKDGTFEYLGRRDQQLKVGGVRLETAEIEQAILALPSITEVHVTDSATLHHHRSPEKFCTRCGLADNFPDVSFTETGLCHLCAEYDEYKERAQAYFLPEPELEKQIALAGQRRTGDYDAIMLLSGGKDSTYAAYRLAALTPRVLAVTLDNGYISDRAKTNIQLVSDHLGWEHRFLSTDKMNEIFVDSLKTHANVCQGCFKAAYTLALRTARAEGAPMIVTGLSRGQFFETRLTPELFKSAEPSCAQLDALVSEARKTYHAEDDAVARLLNTEDIRDGRVLEEIEILDIYRYIDVPVSEIYSFLAEKSPWQRPDDTGRSTNCLINDVGIQVHKTRKGFHNYALPYSWDVRVGHKTRSQAIEELDDEIDRSNVQKILDEIGFDEPLEGQNSVIAYVATEQATEEEVWQALRDRLMREMLPKYVVLIPQMPLTPNGKVDTARLPAPREEMVTKTSFVAPESAMEKRLAAIITRIIKTEAIGLNDDFLDIGIDSLAAIQIAIAANETGIALPTTAVFEFRTLRRLAEIAGERAPVTDQLDDAPLLDLDDADLASIAKAVT